MNPLVSVIIPVYNVENYLGEALDCIVNQTYPNIEIIIVNDGSTDGSLQICNQFADIYKQIKVITQENKGLSGARNTGLKYCNGEYIYFFDSDDLLELSAIDNLVTFSKSQELEVVLMDAEVFGEITNLNLETYTHPNLVNESVYSIEEFVKQNINFKAPVWLYFYKSTLILENDLAFEPSILHEDELFTPLVLSKVKRVGYISQPFFKRRYRPNSIMTSKSNGKLHSIGYEIVVKKLRIVKEDTNSKIFAQFIDNRMERCALGMVTKGNSSIKAVLRLVREMHMPYLKIASQALIYKNKKVIKKIVEK